MSPTRIAGIPSLLISPTLAMSLSIRLSSAGDPDPSQTTNPCSEESLEYASAAASIAAARSMGQSLVTSWCGLPRRTIWITPPPDGFRSMGFMSVSGSRPQDHAWNAWPMPISPPSRVA